MALRVKVVSTDQREESVRTFLGCGRSKKKLYVVFELSVQVGEVEPSFQWRKYKEFAKLDETLRSKDFYIPMQMPDKKDFKGRGNVETNNMRIDLLNKYLESVSCGSAGSSVEFMDWLGVHEDQDMSTNKTDGASPEGLPVMTMGSDKMLKIEEPEARREVEQLVTLAENRVCVDCGAAYAGSTWVSCNLGCVFCMKCSGIHRSLGVHLSFVKSVELDLWTSKDLKGLRESNNQKINEAWLKRCGEADPILRKFLEQGPAKSWMEGNDEARTLYIRHKYDTSTVLETLLAQLGDAGVDTSDASVVTTYSNPSRVVG